MKRLRAIWSEGTFAVLKREHNLKRARKDNSKLRDIQKTMQEMYGIHVDDSRVSKITDKILPLIKEWQERPLQSVYAMVILDAIHYYVRDNGIVTKKAAYVAIGTDLEGRKDVPGIWLGANESAKYWLSVLNGLKIAVYLIY